ncbi:restriction endonuclease subunit S [Reichenbachiella agariperforans]|uniref:restriction endonuclease subunit S n=1 Tax=Reichenbachiella agariperforans TaxID=156994 RepID=UPI001C081121|nr:restriction endonuclease subunit S [Reichenbachiella agariperforans]MBU2915962.1 restriction endonuclease subunit S [Reichenbachiella agariperforans]
MNREMVPMVELIDEISMGPFGSDITVDNFVKSGVPVLNGSNISGVKMKEKFENYLTPEKADSLKKANAKRGDIVITHRGTLGQIGYIPYDSKLDRYVISQSQFRVRLRTELMDPVYFTYYFHSNEGQKRLLSFKNHVGVPALAQATTNFRLLEFPYRPLKEQRAIAKTLSDLDAKIELNNKINEQLEAMAKLIYDYWFVQFDFPISKEQAIEMGKPELEGKPYKASGGKMVYSEQLKREIPEGWEVKSLSEVTSFLSRGISPKYLDEQGSCVINQKCIRQGTVLFDQSRRNDESKRDSSKKRVELLDVLVNSTGVGTLGRVSLVRRLPEKSITVDSHVTIARADELKVNKCFFGYSLLQKQPEIEKFSLGSTGQVELSRAQLETVSLIIPPKDLQVRFDKIYEPIFKKVANNEIKIQKLSELRDWLLPMLMNGQVTVKEAKGYVEQEVELGMAAEPDEDYKKESNIPDNRKAFAKQVLAGKIIKECMDDTDLSTIKLQKLIHLSEYMTEANLDHNYYYQTAGPYDNKLMHSLSKKMNNSQWFASSGHKWSPLDKHYKIDEYFGNYFGHDNPDFLKVMKCLSKASEAQCELISTLYAVWNDRLIKGETVDNQLLSEDFYAWSDRKHNFTSDQVSKAIEWMKKTGFEPRGFGSLIKRKKGK